MQWFRDLPIKRKLSLVVMLASSGALLIASMVLIASEMIIFRRELAHNLIVLTSGIGYNSTAALDFNDRAAATETLSALRVESHVMGGCLYAEDGVIFATYVRRDTKIDFPSKPGPDGYVFKEDYLVLFRPVIQENRRVGTIYVQADLDAVHDRLRMYAGMVAAVLIVAFFVSFLFSAILQRFIARPILDLAATTKAISERKDYSVRAELRSQDELGMLTNGFNQMLASIQERETALSQTNEALKQEIAERIRTQEELTRLNETLEQRVAERTHEAVEANRAKSEFLANMSHELRTPLNSVIGFANILLKNKNKNLHPDDLTFLDRIVANGKHLLSLINQILDLSKIEARKVDLELAPVSLDVMVREVVGQLDGQVRGRDVRLLVELPPVVAPFETDAAKLKQVLINLVGNALKFTEKGRVTVRVITDPATDRPTRIDVADTGVGIPKERLGMIFEAFQQADPSTARKFGGTGLGLTISQALCQLMGYRIEVASEVNKGSTFRIVLTRPAERQPGTAGTDSSTERLSMKPSTTWHGKPLEEWSGLKTRVVLVIDDEPDARLLLTHFIEECGYRVITAGSGEEGFRMAKEVQPDLITLDLLMPRMDGWQVLSAIKTDAQIAHIPVVVISVVAREKKGTVFGAVEVLQKPITREELLPVLKRTLGHKTGKVLVVDDADDDRRLLTSYLAEEEVEIETAVNGQDGLNKIEQFAPDLVILDLIMPVMDGVNFLSRIRRDSRYRHVPVIVCTVKELNAAEKLRLGQQAQAVLQKTEDMEKELKRVLRELLRHPHSSARRMAAGLPPPPG
ncbi:MAG: response regulator [Verrucomicrobia bacterium]|nr:response regulator [Verrucomicrobiota bacterium]